MISIEGYTLFRQDRHNTQKKRGGGIVVYVRDHKDVKVHPDKSICNDDIELMVLQMSLVNVHEIYILATYRPPDGNVTRFVKTCDDIIMNLTNKAVYEVNLVGDININCNKRDPNSRRYKDFMKRHCLVNLINGDTYHHYNGTSSPVDHFLTNNPELYALAGICPFSQSDHDVIFGVRKKHKEERDKVRVTARKYKKLDNNAFRDAVDGHDWSEILSCTDVDRCWDGFVHDFNSILDCHAPWKDMLIDDNLPVWATRELLSCCKRRDALEKRLKYQVS